MKYETALTINIRGRLLSFGPPWIMGILNVTSDSFYSGCRTLQPDEIRKRVCAVRDEGADCIDVGACSTRPGADPVDEDTESRRLEEALRIIREEWPDAIVSVDTFRASVARRAVGAGADIINDISGGKLDERMLDTVAELKVPYVLTHMRGTPATMSQYCDYTDVTADVLRELAYTVRELRMRGVCDIIIDPGFGFAKDMAQNYRLLSDLKELSEMGLPVLAGLSRKSMIWKPLGASPADVLPATVALNAFALLNGADILRVHDVAAAVQTRQVLSLIKENSSDEATRIIHLTNNITDK